MPREIASWRETAWQRARIDTAGGAQMTRGGKPDKILCRCLVRNFQVFAMSNLAFVYDQAFQKHLTPEQHPESPRRLAAIEAAIEEAPLHATITRVSPRIASADEPHSPVGPQAPGDRGYGFMSRRVLPPVSSRI